jgi:methyl-accepting chemotaxis protein
MRLTIARKLWLVFAIMLVLLAAVGALAVATLSAARTAVADLIEIQGVAQALDRSAEQLLLERAALDRYFTTGEDRYATNAQAAQTAHSEAWAIVKEYGLGEGLGQVDAVENAAFAYHTVLQRSLDAYEGNPDELAGASMQLDIADEHYNTLYASARDQLSTEMRARVLVAQDYVGRQLTAMTAAAVSVGILAFVIAASSAFFISRGITSAARHLATAAESISRGDLDVPIEVKTGDEMQDLAESIERMRASLKAAIERLRRRTATV